MRKPKPFRTDVFSPVKLNLLIIKQLPLQQHLPVWKWTLIWETLLSRCEDRGIIAIFALCIKSLPLRSANRAARSHGGKAMRIVQHQKKSVSWKTTMWETVNGMTPSDSSGMRMKSFLASMIGRITRDSTSSQWKCVCFTHVLQVESIWFRIPCSSAHMSGTTLNSAITLLLAARTAESNYILITLTDAPQVRGWIYNYLVMNVDGKGSWRSKDGTFGAECWS